MLEQLYKAKKAALAKYEALNNKLKVEKRSVFNNDELVEANNIKIELEDLNKQIQISESMEAEKKSMATQSVNVTVTPDASVEVDIVKQTEAEVKAFMENVKNGRSGSFVLSPEFLISKYATTTTSTNGGFVQTSALPGVSVQEPSLVLQKAGAQRLFFAENSGNQRVNSMSHIKGTFKTEAGSSLSNKDLTSAYADLQPEYVAVPLKVSRKFFQSISKSNLDAVIQSAVVGIEKAIEERGLKTVTGVTTATGSTIHKLVLNAEANVLGSGSAYIADAKATSKLKDAMKGASSTTNVWANDNTVNGYPALRSGVLADIVQNKVIYGDFRDILLASWGAIKIDYIFDSSLAASGEIMINVSTEADAKCANSASFSQFSTATF